MLVATHESIKANPQRRVVRNFKKCLHGCAGSKSCGGEIGAANRQLSYFLNPYLTLLSGVGLNLR